MVWLHTLVFCVTYCREPPLAGELDQIITRGRFQPIRFYLLSTLVHIFTCTPIAQVQPEQKNESNRPDSHFLKQNGTGIPGVFQETCKVKFRSCTEPLTLWPIIYACLQQ